MATASAFQACEPTIWELSLSFSILPFEVVVPPSISVSIFCLLYSLLPSHNKKETILALSFASIPLATLMKLLIRILFAFPELYEIVEHFKSALIVTFITMCFDTGPHSQRWKRGSFLDHCESTFSHCRCFLSYLGRKYVQHDGYLGYLIVLLIYRYNVLKQAHKYFAAHNRRVNQVKNLSECMNGTE